MSNAETLYDAAVLEQAERTAAAALADLLGQPGRRGGVVVSSPAGAGKTQFVARAVCAAREGGLRVAVATPTNDQAFGLVERLARVYSAGNASRTVAFVPAQGRVLPDAVRALPGVRTVEAKQAPREPLIVGTLNKLGDAFARGDLAEVDVLLVDEAYQADAARYFGVAGLAPRHLLVGDAGQLNPFTTMDDPCRWRGLPEDPLQTAVGVLRRNHPATPVHGLPVTRRLDGRAARMARHFYPALPFAPAVLPGVRELRLAARPAKGRQAALDAALRLAAREGWAHLELPAAAVLPTDPEAVEVLANLVRRLLALSPEVRCERRRGFTPLAPCRVAVGVSHNDQKDLLRARLDGLGLGEVVVETANRLQGLEYEVVFVWHPLAGLPEADPFHVDPGRMCVLTTRHRQACVIVGRAGARGLVEERLPPPTAAYLGEDADPVLDGWEAHRRVFAALEPFHVRV